MMSALLLSAISSNAAFLLLMELQFHWIIVKLLSNSAVCEVVTDVPLAVDLLVDKSMNLLVERQWWVLNEVP